MSEKLVYLSQEWVDEAIKRLKVQMDENKAQMNNITASMTDIYLNCPDGKKRYLFMKMENGGLSAFEVGDGEPPQAEFVLTGEYSVFAKISRGELGSQLAIMTNKLKFKGNMVRALKLVKFSDRMNQVLAGIPTDFKEGAK